MNKHELIKYQENMVRVRENHLEREKKSVATELRDLANKIEAGRIFTNDARNTIGILEDLFNLKKELEMEEEKLNFLNHLDEE